MPQETQSVKCTRDIRAFPWQSYLLPEDGRKARAVCDQRRGLAMQLASYADADGTSIRASLKRLYTETGWKPRTVDRRLAELERVGPGLLSRQGLTKEHGVVIRRLNVSVLRMPGADSPHSAADSPDSPEQIRQIAEQVRHIAGADSPHSGADSPHMGGEQPTDVPPAQTGHQPPPKHGAAGWWRKHTATMNAPGKNQERELDAMGAQHGSEITSRAVELLLERGLGNARNPWAVFISGADAWIQRAEQEQQDAIQKMQQAEIIEAYVAKQKAEEVAWWSKAPAPENGCDASEFFAEMEAQQQT